MKRAFVWANVVSALLLATGGCASIQYKDAKSISGNDYGGFVYYDDSPYLIVYPDGKGSVTWQIQYFPDQTKERVAVPQNFIASLNSSLTFQNGILTGSNVTVDETELLKAVGSAIQTLGPLALAGAGSAATPSATVHVYKIEITGETAQFIPAKDINGTDGVTISVPLN